MCRPVTLAIYSISAMAAAVTAATAEAVAVQQVFNFSSYVSTENSILRPNGHILFSTITNANLYTINPLEENPQAQIVATMEGATALTGFAQIGEDKYVVTGGVRGSYHYDNETLYTIDFAENSNGTIGIAATLPEAIMLNGAASLPDNEGIVLLADSQVACIWRVNITSGTYDKAIVGDFLAAPANATLPIGVNGLKVRAGYVWFTNTATGVFGRVPIDSEGYPTGDNETIATVSTSTSWDDFNVFADDGSSLNCQSPDMVALVSPNGTVTDIVGPGAAQDGVEVLSCSSIIVENEDEGNRSAYVTTKGDSSGLGGQIIHFSF